MQMWRCTVCKFIWEGEEPPEKCPRCGALREKFEKISEEGSELIERSRLTNSLHAHLHSLLSKIIDVCGKGIEDNLDPGCVKIFKESKEFAEEMMRKIKAEIEVHIAKGKWG